jgi:hypothetical protein
MFATMMILAAAALQQEPPVQQEPPIIVEGERLREKPICRTERQTGSRLVRQICRTPTEQRQADLEARNKMRLGTSSTQPTEAFKRPKGE